MDNIDVHDLPESVARALAEQAEFLRKQFAKKKNGGAASPIEFAERLGTVYGQLTREEIYADDDDE